MLGINRLLLILCGIALLLVNYFPIWLIQLTAPQYPEGLELLIYSDKLAGNVDIINGLNHYIGMKTLHTDDFVEFTILPYLIIFFAFAFIGAGIWGKRFAGYTVLGLFALFGILAMVDFWKWEYDYGHNLNPEAAIIVPGMSYQPPLIGFKQLLNFGAYSIPAVGGWIFILAGIVAACCMFREWQTSRRRISVTASSRLMVTLALLSVGIAAAQSCGVKGAQPIQIGVDACSHCKMTISDARFGCELVTNKGRAYKFDDLKCMLSYLEDGTVSKTDVEAFYLADFHNNGQLLVAKDLYILHSEAFRSPMGGNLAGFKTQADLSLAQEKFPGTQLKWEELLK
ncbi:copper chaperone NosL [Dyadobacter psychrophilus]|uniref:Copper chaperone NosL n=2 Tax=Dyadobacter psychrophilus TaxID=651661 RepID=A0A1T5B7C7_9BACT|nr:copper chaperone NosL [Dyadobacter psychrophilus]